MSWLESPLPQLARRVVCGGLLLLASWPSCSANRRIDISMSPVVWLGVEQAHWPSDSRSVAVQFNSQQDDLICGRPLIHSVQLAVARREIVFGVSCGQLWVLMPPLNDQLKEASAQRIAAHEAFHAMMLATARRVRLDVGVSDIEPDALIGARDSSTFFITVIRALDQAAAEPKLGSTQCINIASKYSGLDQRSRALVNHLMQTEWPAEFYMRQTDPNDSPHHYAAFRNKATDLPYRAGGAAMNYIDRVVGRTGWQERFSAGDSILDLLLDSLGCPSLHPGGAVMVTVEGQLTELVDQ